MSVITANISNAPQSLGASGVLAQAGLPADQSAQVQTPTDAQVVSKVVSTEIKPSSVQETAQPTQEVIAKTAQQLESFVHSMGRDLSFSVDSTTGYHVVRVTNPETGEVVRQLPSEELLKIAQTMEQTGSGLVNQKA